MPLNSQGHSATSHILLHKISSSKILSHHFQHCCSNYRKCQFSLNSFCKVRGDGRGTVFSHTCPEVREKVNDRDEQFFEGNCLTLVKKSKIVATTVSHLQVTPPPLPKCFPLGTTATRSVKHLLAEPCKPPPHLSFLCQRPVVCPS